jgi:hypothetical protein
MVCLFLTSGKNKTNRMDLCSEMTTLAKSRKWWPTKTIQDAVYSKKIVKIIVTNA